MMEIERLIEQLRSAAKLEAYYNSEYNGLYNQTANALEKLRTELEQAKAERDAAVEDICVAQWISCKYGTGCDFISARTGRPDCAGCGGWEWRGIKED